MIRRAETSDAAAIADIWNVIIRDTLVTFNSVEKSARDVSEMIDRAWARGHGFWVACEHERILGFATYDQFRGGVGYAKTVEHTIILTQEAHGKGIGRSLMAELEAHAKAAGAHTIFAGVSAENPAGVAFHKALGYREVTVLEAVGYKFGKFIDLHLLQKFL